MWEDLKGGVVWHGLDENYSGRYEEKCAIVMSERAWKCMTEYKWKGTRIVWVKCNSGIVNTYEFVCVYDLVDIKTMKGKNEKMNSGKLNKCLKSLKEEGK